MDANRPHDAPRTDRTTSGQRPARIRRGRRAATVVLATVAVLATLAAATATPASAATVDAVATIASPGTTTPLASGGSTTQFTVSLPAQAACSGDTASSGYHVYSYLVPKGTNLSTVTFQLAPSVGLGLFDTTGTYYGPANTAISTGQIIGIPNDFEWAPIISKGYAPLTGSTGLLYTGSGASASGIWEAGLACANTSGVLVDNWNTEVTFSADSSDANGFTWTAIPGPSGSAPAAISSATSTTFTEGTAGTFTPTATGTPAPTITESGSLPTGVTFTGGKLAGTPTESGDFPITFTATNGIGSPGTQDFTLHVVSGPAVTSIAPTSGPAAGGTTVVITGTNLDSATAVTFGSAPATNLTANTATSVTATSPAGTGTVDVTVTTAGGTSAITANDKFTYVPAPAVSSIAPTSGTPAGGTTVVITGTNLGSATAVTFGSAPATNLTANTATSVTATSPAGTGTVDVTVTTAGGTSAITANDKFTYVPAPDRELDRPVQRPDGRRYHRGHHRHQPGLGHRGQVRHRPGDQPHRQHGHLGDRHLARRHGHRRRDRDHRRRYVGDVGQRQVHLRHRARDHLDRPDQRPDGRRHHRGHHRHQPGLGHRGQLRHHPGDQPHRQHGHLGDRHLAGGQPAPST